MSKNNIIISIMTFVVLLSQLFAPIKAFAQEEVKKPRIYDIYTKEYSNTFDHTNSYISVDPTIAAGEDEFNAYHKTVTFKAKLTGYLHYDYLSHAYVSASSPVITLEYVGDKVLYLDSATTYYHDNGNSVTFYYSANVMGRVPNAIPIIINYGNISGSFTVNK